MEVFSDIGLGPIRADGGVTHRNQGSKKQNSKSNTNTQKTNTITKKNTKRVTYNNQGTKDKNVRTEFFAAIIGIDISQTLPLAMRRNNEIPNINIVLSDQSDGWMDGWP